jgi:hypothetical protein
MKVRQMYWAYDQKITKRALIKWLFWEYYNDIEVFKYKTFNDLQQAVDDFIKKNNIINYEFTARIAGYHDEYGHYNERRGGIKLVYSVEEENKEKTLDNRQIDYTI